MTLRRIVLVAGNGEIARRTAEHAREVARPHGYLVRVSRDAEEAIANLLEHDVAVLVVVAASFPPGDEPSDPTSRAALTAPRLLELARRTRPDAERILVGPGSALPSGSRDRVLRVDPSQLDDELPRTIDLALTRRERLEARHPSPAVPDEILVTGGLGFLGRRLVRTLLEETDCRLWLLVRPKDGIPPATRVAGAIPDAYRSRVRVVEGDLASPPRGDGAPSFGEDLGLLDRNDPDTIAEMLERVDGILHVGAYLSFLDDEREKHRLFDVNVGGTGRLLTLANRLRRPLVSFDYVGTAFVHGTSAAPRRLRGTLERPTNWCNFYERTKWWAETLVRNSGLPWRVFRPSIICEDPDSPDRSAETIYGILDVVATAVARARRRGAGRLRVRIPTHPETLSNFIQRRDVVRVIVDVIRSGKGFGCAFDVVNPVNTIGTWFWNAIADALDLAWEPVPTVPTQPDNLVEALFYRLILPRYEGYLFRRLPVPVQEELREVLGRDYPERTIRPIDRSTFDELVMHHLELNGRERNAASA